MLRRSAALGSTPALNLITKIIDTRKHTIRSFSALTPGKGEDAKKESKTYNTNIKDVAIHSRIHIYKESDHFSSKIDKGLLKYTKLKPLEENKFQTEPAPTPSKEILSSLKEFMEAYTGKKIKGEVALMYMDGNFYPTRLVNTALNRVDTQPAVALAGVTIRRNGYSLDQMPAFGPVSLYGGRQQALIANTNGLRESDLVETVPLARKQIHDFAKRHEGCVFVYRVVYLDVRIGPDHATLGGTVSKDAEKSPIGQAHHIQTQFGYYDKDENFTALYTQESTGSANHPTGENSEFPSYSYNGDHRNAPTNDLPVRTASKDGKLDLSPITSGTKEDHGQNGNLFYALEGDSAQQPPGLTYTPKYYVDVVLSIESAEIVLSEILLAEKAGQVIISDEMIPNKNEKYSESNPLIHKVISAGSFGQHAQSGGLFMCASTALDQAFGEAGIAWPDEGRPFLHNYQKPETTYDTFTNLTLYAMSNDTKNVILRDSNQKRISPEDYKAVLGKGTVENYRRTIVAQREKSRAGDVTDMGKESDEIFMVNGAGVTIPISLEEPSFSSIPIDNMTPFLAQGRELHSRYTRSQQTKDFGRNIGADTPIAQEEVQALTALFKEMGKVYRLSEAEIQACINEIPAPPDLANQKPF